MTEPLTQDKAGFTLTDTVEQDVECGYVTDEALCEVDRLTPEQVVRLAAMAITHYTSPWSDRERDLLRGVSSVLRRAPWEAGKEQR